MHSTGVRCGKWDEIADPASENQLDAKGFVDRRLLITPIGVAVEDEFDDDSIGGN